MVFEIRSMNFSSVYLREFDQVYCDDDEENIFDLVDPLKGTGNPPEITGLWFESNVNCSQLVIGSRPMSPISVMTSRGRHADCC